MTNQSRTALLLLLIISSACNESKLDQTSIIGAKLDPEMSEIDKSDRNQTPILLDLSKPSDNLYAWRKTRASLDPQEDVIFYWQGYIYHQRNKDSRQFPQGGYNVDFESPLFKFEGFNVARFAEDGAGGYYMVSREVSVYENPDSGEIINCWENSLLPERPSQSVMHVANDPVNFGVGEVNYTTLGDQVSFFSDILLAYRSPLADREELAPFSASDVYQSNELFNFYVTREDLEDPTIQSAPVNISWTRIGQYLPWMQMGNTPGKLIYHVRGYKVLKGLEALPSQLLEWTVNVAGPKFLTSPDTVPQGYQANATTWRVFKEVAEAGAYSPLCR